MTELSEEDRWISERVPNCSFMDIGGLWGLTGEKITVAHRYGASSLTMVDHLDNDELWKAFRDRTEGLDVKVSNLDIEYDDVENRIEKADVVYCNGLLYHSANPLHFLQQVAAVTGEYLCLGSIHSGRYGSEAEYSVFVPVAPRSYMQNEYNFPIGSPAYGITVEEIEWMKEGRPNARPFWWLHSKLTIQKMLELVGFEVEKAIDCWDNRVVKFLCRRKTDA